MNKIMMAHLAAATAALSAGVAVVATRFVVGETDPAALAFYRYVIGVMCFVPLFPFIWPKHQIKLREYGKIAILGVLFFCFFPWAFNASLQYIPAARGAVGLATIPIQTLIVAVLLGREAMTPAKLAGVGLAFVGIVVVFGPEAVGASSSDYLIGDGLMILGGFCAALYSVLSRATLARHGPMFVTALAMVFGALALYPFTLFETGSLEFPSFSAHGWLAVVFLGTFAGAIQFTLFTWALRWLPPTVTVLYLTLNPITAMLLSVLLIGEALTAVLVFGLMLVISGIVVGNGLIAGKMGKASP